MGEQGGQMTMPVGPQTKSRLTESSKGLKELLPGIPDSITLTHIAPKLPWRAVRILSLVSAAWQRAVHSREVYQARISAGSTETFVVLCHTLPRVDDYSVQAHAISIYSLEDKHCYQLPAIPGLIRGIPWSCQCISLDGKVYILGGEAELYGDDSGCKEVYELDVAGKWEWKRCADMQHGRMLFACDVKDKQIYAFGGCSYHNAVRESEVYDPRADTWSSIVPAMSSKSGHQATTLGEDLVVHDGYSHDPGYYMSALDHTNDLEVYHPSRNEWKVVMLHGTAYADYLERTYFAHGKLHSMTSSRIYVLDVGIDEYTLTHLQSSSYEDFGPLVKDQTLLCVNPCVARVVNGELLALVNCYTRETVSIQTFLLQSKGFGSENKELVWEKAACSLSFGHRATPVICPIQL